MLRRVGAAVAAAIAVGTVASTTSQAAARPAAIKAGGTVNVGIFDTIPSTGWCSNSNPANSALMVWRTIYETLFEKTTSGQMVGLLAESATPSADLKTWTIKLRKGIKFSDGEPFNAEAVKTNIEYAGGHYGFGKIWLLGTAVAFIANIAEVTVKDTYTAVFRLDRAQNDLPNTLYASGRFFMRSPKMFASADACAKKPVGTGPFMVEDGYSLNTEKTTVVKNKNYWRKDPVTKAKLPYLDKIVFENIKEASQRSIALRSGKVQAAMFSAAGEAKFIQDLRAKKATITEYKSPSEYYPSFWFNQAKIGSVQSPFNVKACREAVSYALDRKTYVKVRMRNEGTVADSLVGPSSVMYNKKNFITYNLTKAKAKAAECKTALGKDLEFTIPSDTSSVSQNNAKEIQSQLAKANITMNIKTEESAEIIKTAFKAIAGNQYQAIPILLMEGTDVSFNLPFLVTNMFTASSTNPAKSLKGAVGSILNLNRHTDTKVDEILYAGEAAKSAAAAKKKYQEATAYIQKEALMTSINRFYYDFFTNKKIGGVGKLQLVKGKTQRIVTNWGIDWTGVYLKG